MVCDQSNKNILIVSVPEEKNETELKATTGAAASPPDITFSPCNSERHHDETTGTAEIPSSSPQNVDPYPSNMKKADCAIEDIQSLGPSKLATVAIPVSDEEEPAGKEDSSGISELPQGVSSQSCLKGTMNGGIDEAKKSAPATG